MIIQSSRCHLSQYTQKLGPHQAQATVTPAVWCRVRAIVHHVILGRLSLPIKPIMRRLCPYWEGYEAVIQACIFYGPCFMQEGALDWALPALNWMAG